MIVDTNLAQGYALTVVTAPVTVTAIFGDKDPVELLNAEKPGQYGFVAVSGEAEISQDDAIVTPVSGFSCALSGAGTGGGGSIDGSYITFNDGGEVSSFDVSNMENIDYIFKNRVFEKVNVTLASNITVSCTGGFDSAVVKNVTVNLPAARYLSNLFYNSTVEEVVIENVMPNSMSAMFQNADRLKKVSFVNCDLSRATLVAGLFNGAGSTGFTVEGELTFNESIGYAFMFNKSGVSGKVILRIPNATGLSSLFNQAPLVEEIDLTVRPIVGYNISNVATECSSLKRILWRTIEQTSSWPATTVFYNTFKNCPVLEDFEILGKFPSSLSSTFADCTSLTSVKGDVSDVKTLMAAFAGCTSLTDVPLSWPALTSGNMAFTNCGLTALQINEILTSLQSFSSGSRSITFVGCPGAVDCDPTIGTAKGWTVQI